MSAGPVERVVSAATRLRLAPFERCYAPLVAGWTGVPIDAYWLAPRTPPPITAAKVLGWIRPGTSAMLLSEEQGSDRSDRPCEDARAPLAYGEINILEGHTRAYWLGHLLVAPEHRGRGVGRQLTEHLLRHAFERFNARRVTLVVFPDNKAAIACYESAGMRIDGHEDHHFAVYGHTVRMVRMAVTRS